MEACRHCGKGRVTRPRKLCWNCYYKPGVRKLYPPLGGNGSQKCRRAKPASHATDALPGSLEKILVLMRRAELRQELWHPDDAPMGGRDMLGKAG